MFRINSKAKKAECCVGEVRRNPSVGLAIYMTALLFLFVLFLGSCSDGAKQAVSATDFALGTTCSVKLFGEEHKELLQPALDEAKRIEELMSVNLEDSEISRINAAAGIHSVQISDETVELLQRASEYSALGEGVFDLTVGPLVKLWDIGSGDERVPGPEQIEEAVEKIDYTALELKPVEQRAYLTEEEMRIDLGAIAKGFAADKIVEYLEKRDVQRGIVNLGGNVYAFGEKEGNQPWKIGIQSPEDDRGTYLGIVEVRDRAVVTSGKYERFFIQDGKRYHHILSTENGYPIENGVASVSVISRDATASDALSTLLFGLGLEAGLSLSEKLEGIEAIFVTERHTVYTTTGLRESFTLTDSDFKRGESKVILQESQAVSE